SDHLIGDVAGPRGLFQVPRAFGISPGGAVGNSASAEAGGRGDVIGRRVRNVRKYGGILGEDRPVPLVAVQVAVGEVAQQGGSEDVVPVKAVYPGVLWIRGTRIAQLDRQLALRDGLGHLPPDGEEEVILIAPVMVGSEQIFIEIRQN